MRSVSTFFLSAFLALVLGSQAHGQADINALLDDPAFYSAELSPEGNFVAGIRLIDLEEKLLIADLSSGEANFISVDGGNINWIEWATEDRLMMSVSAYFTQRNRRVSYKQVVTDPDVRAYRVTRLVAINRDGSNQTLIFDNQRRLRRNFNLAQITDFLDDDPDHILMPARVNGDLDLFKVNITTGDYEAVAFGDELTIGWYTDDAGEPAMRLDINRRGTRFYFLAREARENGRTRWKRFETVEIRSRRDDDEEQALFRPIRSGPDEDTYYVVARPDGAETSGIYLYNFVEETYVATLATHPRLDITRGYFDGETDEFLGHAYWEDRLVQDFVDPALQAHFDGLNAYFGNELNVRLLDMNRDGRKWLIYSFGPTDAGSWHLYDLDEVRVDELGNRMSNLPLETLAPMKTIRYQSRDGLEITGYLTRPLSAEEGDTPPLIMLPHGGPEVRDYFTYNREVQMLAALGYQVFQPNFRGSDGYGQNFVEMGHHQWGRAMQDDIDDGYNHLVEQGLTKYGNACIFGTSYGGYAALVGATRNQGEYRCAISTAGPSNLVRMLNWERREFGRDSDTYDYWTTQIGDPRNDRDELLAVSPEANPELINIPVLLMHGDEDQVVPVEESKRMRRALERAGRDVTYVELEDATHSWRSPEVGALEVNETIKFLTEHLPVAE